MGQPDKALINLLEHGKLDAAEHMKGVDLHIDDLSVKTEEFIGTDGVTDVFVFDAGIPAVNIALLKNFDPGEDYFLFQNTGEGRELAVGHVGEQIGFNFVLFYSTGDSANIVVTDMPFIQQAVEQMVLPFDGYIQYYDH